MAHSLVLGVVADEWIQRLRSFKDKVRNPYSHYNIKKITKDMMAWKVKIGKVDTGQIEEKNIAAVHSPVIQTQAKPFVDAHNVLEVFSLANEVVRHLLKRIDG